EQRLAIGAATTRRSFFSPRRRLMYPISRRWLLMLGFVFICAAPSALAFAQDNFYRGKTIRLVVGLAPGGGFDTYSRVIARHTGKHISGNPTTIVDNMPGAATL